MTWVAWCLPGSEGYRAQLDFVHRLACTVTSRLCLWPCGLSQGVRDKKEGESRRPKGNRQDAAHSHITNRDLQVPGE